MTRPESAGIKAITFDVGGTLIEPWPSVGHVYCDVARQFGIEALPADVTAAFVDAWRSRKNFGYTRDEWFSLVGLSFRREIDRELFDAIYHRFTRAEAWRVYDDVEPALRLLRQKGFKLAVISNWDERLEPLLIALGLRSWFDALFISLEIGFHKPQPEIFDHAAHALNLPPQQILHIGDSEREDLLGARNAGFHSAKIARTNNDDNDLLQIVNDWL